MAHIVTDRVLETTTTTGTGAIALGGAVSQFQDFDSQMANADTTAYFIKGISGSSLTEWEVGLGTWNTGNTLSRTTVIRSSNANAAVTFSAGTKLIGMTFTPTVRQPGMSFTGALTPATNDLAALGSASLSWADLFLANNGVINWNNGDITLTQGGADVVALAGGGLQLGFSSTAVPPININTTTLTTTTSAGFLERDATNFYGTTATGNRGYIPVKHFIRSEGNTNLTNTVNTQAVFKSPTNGQITLETGTYLFKFLYLVTSMSATSGNAQVLFGGAATVASWLWWYNGLDNTSFATISADLAVTTNTNASAASAVTAGVGTALRIHGEGTFEVTGAGTFIPQIDLVTAAAAVLQAGSYFLCERIGSTTVVSVGQWD